MTPLTALCTSEMLDEQVSPPATLVTSFKQSVTCATVAVQPTNAVEADLSGAVDAAESGLGGSPSATDERQGPQAKHRKEKAEHGSNLPGLARQRPRQKINIEEELRSSRESRGAESAREHRCAVSNDPC
jgi:hypothetical protein